MLSHFPFFINVIAIFFSFFIRTIVKSIYALSDLSWFSECPHAKEFLCCTVLSFSTNHSTDPNERTNSSGRLWPSLWSNLPWELVTLGVSIVTMVKFFYFEKNFFSVNFLSVSDGILKGTGLLAGSTLPLRICFFTHLQLFSSSVIIRGSSFVV